MELFVCFTDPEKEPLACRQHLFLLIPGEQEVTGQLTAIILRSPSEVNGEVFEELHRATYFGFQTNSEVHCYKSSTSLSSHPAFTPSFPLVSDFLNLLCFSFYGGSIPIFGRQTVAFQFPCKFAATFCLRVDLYCVLIFVPKQMVWLPVPWSFNTCSDVMACTGMQGQCEHCKTVCAER